MALVAFFNKGVQIWETRLRELRRHNVWDGVVVEGRHTLR